MFNIYLILISVLVGVHPGGKYNPTKGPLDLPISLSGECSNVRIVEWQWADSVNKKAIIEKMDKICNDSVRSFPKFIEARGGMVPYTKPTWDVSLLNDSGYGSLNDTTYRFKGRAKFKNELLGWCDFSNKIIYLSQHYTETTFAHELFHQLSYTSNLIYTHSLKMDDILADQFEAEIMLSH